ncbi:MAG TPA: M3 family metallopeptidase, partial [Methylophilaceae bacterium]|nr:M3 family metallopeptidase [Methylophilaceae bacterium]
SSAEIPTWNNFARPLEDHSEKLHRAWSQIGHLNAVVNSPELREAYNDNLAKLTDYGSDLAQDERLYMKYKTIQASDDFANLTQTQQTIINHEVRDFKLGGAELPKPQKALFKDISEQLSKLSSKFEENIMDNTNDFKHIVDHVDALVGIPADVVEAAAESAKAEGKSGYLFTLHFPSYLPVMQYAENRSLRETMYRAYATRASELSNPKWDNTPLIVDILRLKQEEAKLLGFSNYAELSLATKMADKPAEVIDFLETLSKRAKPYAQRDMDELTNYAKKLGIKDLEAWDVAYISEKLRQEKYAFSDQEVKQYFPEDKVLSGLFKVTETIFGIHVRRAEAPTWHQDVKFFEITDQNDKPIAYFYLDLYARQNKRGGAWMDECISRRQKPSGLELPVAYLTCNFSAPVGSKPALFTHDEVTTMFHEFGHGLHHMLTQVEEYGVSGIKGVEWDAVELPSQFMENFCWEWEVLRNMTAHVDTKKSLPKALYDKMIAAKNFQAGMQTVRQIEFAMFDMRLHGDFDPYGTKTALDVIEEVRDEVAVLRPPQWNRFPNSFSHIFAGGYAAGYYSYKWAEVLSADAYSLFEELGVLSHEAGSRFKNEVLAKGGSRPAIESYIAFRGRSPNMDALLRHNGMTD